MKVNEIYTTFDGEVNSRGIGSPSIFVRLQGCPIRCYKRNLGILCDTPEALSKPTDFDSIESIVTRIEEITSITGIKNITLTGGDPLWNEEVQLLQFLGILSRSDYSISIETSGTLEWYKYKIKNVALVLDYKLKSAGLKADPTLIYYKSKRNLLILDSTDWIKFVIKDSEDVEEFKKALPYLLSNTKANIGVGPFWGGDFNPIDLFSMLERNKLLSSGRVFINMQTHKMAVSSNYKKPIPNAI